MKPGNSVEDKTLATGKGGSRLSWKQHEHVSSPSLAIWINVIWIGEAVDERWQWSHSRSRNRAAREGPGNDKG